MITKETYDLKHTLSKTLLKCDISVLKTVMRVYSLNVHLFH